MWHIFVESIDFDGQITTPSENFNFLEVFAISLYYWVKDLKYIVDVETVINQLDIQIHNY